MSQNPLSVSELFARYLQKQIGAHAQGLGYAEPGEDATPFDAVPVQPVDPQLAWRDAVACADGAWDVPPEWPALVQQQEPAVAIAFCLGNYPQLVRSLHPLLTAEPAALRQSPGQPLALPALTDWAANVTGEPGRYLAAGALRLARHFDEAQKLLAAAPGAAWQAVHGNEAAALAWHRGEPEKALALWQKLPDSAPVLFNRGMAALFLGRADLAAVSLDAAIAQLPETGAWHHLARLYRTLAMAR
jgi:tetratricopeptide (TPR) repeat protein